MGYHVRDIPRGTYGALSKITEEYEELLDALEQDNSIMALVEMADLIGAIEGYALKHHNITLAELVTMKDATKRAFEDGTRTSRDEEPPSAEEQKADLEAFDQITDAVLAEAVRPIYFDGDQYKKRWDHDVLSSEFRFSFDEVAEEEGETGEDGKRTPGGGEEDVPF
jgi:phosphoribosyl-ATP pyrophosphohydrolase